MKYFLPILSFILISYSGLSQDKVIEKSGKKPEWINSVEKGYVITSGKGSSIEEAQMSALSKIKGLIINSVAENISSASTTTTRESRENNSFSLSEDFLATLRTSTPVVPYLKGISISKGEDYYWEKLKHKSGAVHYVYFIKYPFSELELFDLVSEYNIYQKRMEMELNEIEDLIAGKGDLSVDSLLSLAGRINQLQALVSPMQKGLCGRLINDIDQIFRSLYIESISMSKDFIEYQIKQGDKTRKCYIRPRTQTDCADALTYSTIDGRTHKIQLDNFFCKYEKEFQLHISYTFRNQNLKHTFTVGLR
jgi:hypothetical protein